MQNRTNEMTPPLSLTRRVRWCVLATVSLVLIGNPLEQRGVDAFQSAKPTSATIPTRGFISSTQLYKKNPSSSSFSPSSKSASPAGDFAFQEMLVFFNSMQQQGASSRNMDPVKRDELAGYVRTVLANRPSLVPLKDIGKALVPSSKWKLMFSTSDAILESLPPDASVYMNILDEEYLEYVLQFSKKTMGLESLTAKSKYTVDVSTTTIYTCLSAFATQRSNNKKDRKFASLSHKFFSHHRRLCWQRKTIAFIQSGPIQPGLLSFVYENITTNVMGLKNIGVGFFGLLQGRANYVESAYFDGTFWIERGVSPSGDGSDFVSVYMRMDD